MRYNPKIILVISCLILLSYVAISNASQLLKEDADKYRQQGLAAQDQGNLTKAIEYFQKSITLDSENPFVYNDLGVAYEAQGKMSEAEDMYLRSIALDPNFASPYFNLGLLYERKGDYQRAGYYFKKRIEMNLPSDYWSRQALEHLSGLSIMDPATRRLYLRTETNELIREIEASKPQKSKQESREAGYSQQGKAQYPGYRPSEAEIYLNRAKRLYKKKDYVKALRELNKAYFLDPTNQEITELLQKTQTHILLNH